MKSFWHFKGISTNQIQFGSLNTSDFTLKSSQKLSFLDFQKIAEGVRGSHYDF